ncbi:MAG: redoxin family protein [Chloroherpetonaceae bacterium]|nr:redoxin family protein [Chthonomonadaceae bacterium]MDW8207719.1 redoxin family protein [Chloroherpetonaceae bacterium]
MRKGAILLALIATLAGISAATHALKVGDKAPPIRVARWVKGTPVQTFEKGRVYIIEFWATWCPPCRTTIPHLTAIARKHRDRCVIAGISVLENAPDIEKEVTRFVASMGDRMDYHVAIDDRSEAPEGWMARNWMAAANQSSIPVAFVIDKSGRIAWIGHPMDDLDTIVDDLVADRFDPKSIEQRRQQRLAELQKLQQLVSPVIQRMEAGQNREALTLLDRALARNPHRESRLAPLKLELLLRTDEPRGYAYARKLASSLFKDDATFLNEVAWRIVENSTPPRLQCPDYATAILLARRAAHLTEHRDPTILDTLAYAHYKNGERKTAIQIQEKAVALLDNSMPEDVRKEITDRLKRFKEQP